MTRGTKHLFKSWKSFSLQVLSLLTGQTSVPFSRLVRKQRYRKYIDVLRIVHRIWFVRTGLSIKKCAYFLADITAEFNYAIGDFVGRNSKPLLCKLEDGVVFHDSLPMMMFHRDTLTRRVKNIIDRVVEAGLYNYWISLAFNWRKVLFSNIALAHPLDGYYSFNIYHLQTVLYLLLMVWCLSAICFIFEVLYNRVLRKLFEVDKFCFALLVLNKCCYVGFKFCGVYTVLRHPRAIIFCLSRTQC